MYGVKRDFVELNVVVQGKYYEAMEVEFIFSYDASNGGESLPGNRHPTQEDSVRTVKAKRTRETRNFVDLVFGRLLGPPIPSPNPTVFQKRQWSQNPADNNNPTYAVVALAAVKRKVWALPVFPPGAVDALGKAHWEYDTFNLFDYSPDPIVVPIEAAPDDVIEAAVDDI